MPKLTEVVYAYKPLKKFNNYVKNPYTYKIVYPPVLRDYVSNRKVRARSAPCGQEMMVLLSCWKKYDFVETKCSKEAIDFNKCVIEANKQKVETQQSSSKQMTSSETNQLLRRFPQPPHTIKLKE